MTQRLRSFVCLEEMRTKLIDDRAPEDARGIFLCRVPPGSGGMGCARQTFRELLTGASRCYRLGCCLPLPKYREDSVAWMAGLAI